MGKVIVVGIESERTQNFLKITKEKFPEVTFNCLQYSNQVLHYLKTENPDYIIIDVDSQLDKGIELCKNLKYHPETEIIPIVFTSNNTKCENLLETAKYCQIDYIVSKPITNNDFILLNQTLHKLKSYNILRLEDKKNSKCSITNSNYNIEETYKATLNLLEDLKSENTARKRSEEALTISETKYRRLFETSKDGILIIDAVSGKIVDFNPLVVELFETNNLSIKDRIIWDIEPFKMLISSKEQLVELRSNEFIRYENLSLKTILGNTLYIELICTVYNVNDKTLIQCNLRDISKRKKALDELENSREQYKDLIELAVDGVLVGSFDGHILDANSCICSIFGRTRDELIGRHISDSFFTNESIEKSPLQFEKLKNGEIVISDRVVQRPDGAEIIIEMRTKMMPNKTYQSIYRDITERKKTELTLKESEEKYRKTFYISPDSVNINRLSDGMYISINEGFTRIMGYTEWDVLGKSSLEINIWANPEDREKLVDNLTLHGVCYNLEAAFKKKNGEICYGLMSASLLNLKGEQHIISITRDITDRKQAEEVLRESEEQFRAVTEYSTNSICILNEQGKIIYANNAMMEMSGYSKDTIYSANSFKDFVDTESWDFVKSNFEKFVRNESYEQNYSFILKHASGSKIICEKHMTHYKDRNGKKHLVISMLDITDRIHSEEKIQKIGKHYQALIEKAPDGIVLLDELGNFKFISPSAKKIFGYTDTDEINGNPMQFTHPDDLQTVLKHIRKLRQEPGYAPTLQYRFKDKNQKWRWVESTFSNLLSDSSVESIVINFREISERKESESKLQLLSKAIEQSPVSVVITNEDGNIEYVNPKFSETTGYSMGEIYGKNPRILQSGNHSKDFYKNIWTTILSGKNWQGEFHNKKKNGESFWESAVISSIHDDQNNSTFYIAVKEDITEKKKLTEEIIRAKEHAEESDRLKSAFLANMSHEIRTPMNGILGFTELLKNPDLSGTQQSKFIDIIEKSGARMLNIINDIISISKIESGQMDVSISEVNINELTEYIHSFFSPEAEQKGLKLTLRNALINTKSIVKTDYEKVCAILTNLVKNALKFTQSGIIEFGYVVKSSEFEFYVKDTGSGVSPEQGEMIFERFRQGSESLNRNYEGAGLGLSISKAFVEMLGGKIWLQNNQTLMEEATGTTFFFTIPIHSKDLNLIETEEGIELKKLIQPEKRKKLKVLIAEDDESSEFFLTVLIEPFCKEIIIVKNGADAIEKSKYNSDLDLILMDLKMPILDGYSATKEIRKFNKEVKIIAQSAFASSNDREKAIDAGCNDYFSKPIETKKILSSLYKLIDNQ